MRTQVLKMFKNIRMLSVSLTYAALLIVGCSPLDRPPLTISETSLIGNPNPAVPLAATERVRFFGKTEGWIVDEINAGEFVNSHYIKNPINRCYYCKTHSEYRRTP